MRIPTKRATLTAATICLAAISRVQAQVADAFHQVAAETQGGNQTGGTGHIDLNTHSDFLQNISDPDTGFTLVRQSVAHAETFGGTGGPPYRANISASAESNVLVEQETGGVHFSASAQASAVLSYTTHILSINDAGLVWHPTVVPVEIHANGHVNGWGSSAVSIRNSLSNELYLADGAFGTNSLNPKPFFERLVGLDLPPDTYLITTMQAQAISFHTLDPNFESMISSLAVADPVITFNQAAFDVYAASQGQPTFSLPDFFAFEFSAGIGNTVPEPSSLALLTCSALLVVTRRRRHRTVL